MYRISNDSPLRGPHANFSERQIILLDGIRYSADMAGIAFDRLWEKLKSVNTRWHQADTTDIAEAALFAWSIIDAIHRLHDLIANFPVLPNQTWRRIFADRVADALELRDSWQHQANDVDANVDGRRQAWGAIAWAEHIEDVPTSLWCLMVAGTELAGSQWIFAGTVDAIDREDTRRIRLLHGDRQFYLGRGVRDLFEAVSHFEDLLRNGQIRLVGDPVNRERGNDILMIQEIVRFLAPAA